MLKKVFSLILVVSVMVGVLSVGVTVNAAEPIITTLVNDNFEDREIGTEAFASSGKHPDRSDAIKVNHSSTSGVEVVEETSGGNKYVTFNAKNKTFTVYNAGLSTAEKIVWSFDISGGTTDSVHLTLGTGTADGTTRNRFARINFAGSRFDLYNDDNKTTPTQVVKNIAFDTMKKVTIEMSKGTDGNIVINEITCGDTTVLVNQSLKDCVDYNGNSYMNWDTFATKGRLGFISVAPANAVKLDNVELCTVTEVKEAEFENLVVEETPTGAKATVDATVPSGVTGEFMLIVAGYDSSDNMLCVNKEDIVISASATDAENTYDVEVTPEQGDVVDHYKAFIWAKNDQRPMLPAKTH